VHFGSQPITEKALPNHGSAEDILVLAERLCTENLPNYFVKEALIAATKRQRGSWPQELSAPR
jgi:hypothetical protein